MDEISREPHPEPNPEDSPLPPDRRFPAATPPAGTGAEDLEAGLDAPLPPASRFAHTELAADEDAMTSPENRLPPEPGAGAPEEEEEEPAAAVPEETLTEAPPIEDARALSRIVLAALLASRDAVSLLRLAQVGNSTQQLVREALGILRTDLQQAGFPLELVLVGESARLLTSPDVFPYLQRLKAIKRAERLTPAAVETLAVIAYKQPVIRAEVEAIRGVKAGPMLRQLLDHKLIRIKGRRDVPGRPLEYETTAHFLERFGIESLKDLPSLRELKAMG